VRFIIILVRSKTIVLEQTYVLPQMFYLFLFFIPTRDLRVLSTDQRKILQDDQ